MVAMTPDCVVVALGGGPEGQLLLNRGAALAARVPGGRLHGVHVAGRGPDHAPDPAGLAALRSLTEELGGEHHTVTSDDTAEALLEAARGLDATQLVIGVSRRGRLRAALRAGVSDRVLSGAGDLDILVVSHPYARGGVDRRPPGALSTRRRAAGWALAVAGPVLLTLLLSASPHVPTTQALAFLATTVLVALVGGLWPAVAAALLASVLLNYFFTPPLHTMTVADVDNVLALLLFLVVAVAVASVVDSAARRSVQAGLARREADTLSRLNRALLRTERGVGDLLDLVRETFAMEAASVLRRTPDGWKVVATRGQDPPTVPGAADAEADASERVKLLLRGTPPAAHDLRVLAAFATHLAVVLDRAELAAQAAAAERLEQGNRLRTALLAAVSHDLRTPLAGIKAAVSTLRTPGMAWTPEDRDDLLGAVEESADRLGAIIANLLDLSRLQTGGVTLVSDLVGLDDVVSRAVVALPEGGRVRLDLPEGLPPVRVDAGLLERVVANLVDNALRHTAGPVEVTCSTGGRRADGADGAGADGEQQSVLLRVVDHGRGVPEAAKATMFEPFQRLGDAPDGEGVGLGLAVAHGLTSAMAGTLVATDTAGGGLTMTVALPAVPLPARPEVVA